MLPPAGIGAVASDEEGRQLEHARELSDRIPLGTMDPMCAVVDPVDGPDAASEALACFHDLHLVAQIVERACRAKSCNARADHEDAPAADRRPHRGR
jgi:hypothetical protein